LKQVVWIVGLKISVFTCSVFTGSFFTGVSGFFCSVDGVEVDELDDEVELCEIPPPQLYPPHDDGTVSSISFKVIVYVPVDESQS